MHEYAFWQRPLFGMCGNWTGSTNECLMSARWSRSFPGATEAPVTIADDPAPPPLTVAGVPRPLPRGACAKPPKPMIPDS
jgi:hypothetical protein